VVAELDASVLDLKVLEDAWTSVSEDVVGSGQDAAGLAVAEASDELRVRFVVAVVDAAGPTRTAAAVAAQVVTEEAHVVPDAAVIGELDVDAFASRAGQSL